jgi:hypothetical protein
MRELGELVTMILSSRFLAKEADVGRPGWSLHLSRHGWTPPLPEKRKAEAGPGQSDSRETEDYKEKPGFGSRIYMDNSATS